MEQEEIVGAGGTKGSMVGLIVGQAVEEIVDVAVEEVLGVADIIGTVEIVGSVSRIGETIEEANSTGEGVPIDESVEIFVFWNNPSTSSSSIIPSVFLKLNQSRLFGSWPKTISYGVFLVDELT